MVECVRWVGRHAAPAAVKGLMVGPGLPVSLAAALGRVYAEDAGDEDAELEEDDGGACGDDYGQGGAHHLVLAVGPGLDKH